MPKRDVDFFERGELKEHAVRLILLAIALAAMLAILALAAYFATFMSLEEVLEAIISSVILFIGILFGGSVMFVVLRLYGTMRLLNQVVTRSMKVSETRLPAIHRLVAEASGRIGVKAPDAYVVQDPLLNAYAIGRRKKFIVLNTAIVEAMSEKELMFVVGHELSHVKYGRMARVRLGSVSIPVPLLFRTKVREYTCDRGGLLACRDADAAVLALAKLALGKRLADEIDVKTLYAKDDEAGKEKGLKPFDRLASHPQIKDRISRLRKFAESELYRDLADGQ